MKQRFSTSTVAGTYPDRHRWTPGVTLVELLVSLALASLVLAMIASLYLFASKLMFRFQERSAVNDRRILLESELAAKFAALEKIIAAEEQAMEFSTFDGARYNLRGQGGENLYLNTRGLLPPGFQLGSCRWRYLRHVSGGLDNFVAVADKNDNFKIDGEELQSVALVELTYTLIYEKFSGEYTITFSPRSSR